MSFPLPGGTNWSLFPPISNGGASGKVLLPGGAPAVGAQVAFSSPGVLGEGDINGQVTSDSNGNISIPGPTFINAGNPLIMTATYYDGSGNQYAGEETLDQSASFDPLTGFTSWTPNPFTIVLSLQAAANPGVKQAVGQNTNITSPAANASTGNGLFGINISQPLTYLIYAVIAILALYVFLTLIMPELFGELKSTKGSDVAKAAKNLGVG